MEHKRISGRTVFAGALFILSAFVLGIKLINPTPIQIFVEGSKTAVSQIPGFFTTTDVALLIISTSILCISGMYLLFFDQPKPAQNENSAGRIVMEERKTKWEELSKVLKNDEQKVSKAIIESDGIINQAELTEKTGLPKANISRALDLLESRGMIERRRRGMGNVVLLK